MLALAAIAACGGERATAPAKTGVCATASTPALDVDEEQPPPPPDGEYTAPDGSVYCVRNGLIIMAPCPPSILMSITVPDGDTLRPTNETTRFHVDSKHYVVVRVVNTQGVGLAERNVSLAVTGVDTSGSHPHQRALSLLGDRPRGHVVPSGTLTTNADGEATFLYEAPQFGGYETLTARVAGASEVRKELLIREPGLVRVATDGPTYYVEPTINHHPGDNYAAPGVMETLTRIFNAWMDKNTRDSLVYPLSRYPGHGPFKVDALALPYGGRFDIFGNWTGVGGHEEHRSGYEVDFNNDAVERAGGTGQANRMRRLCQQLAAVECLIHSPSTGNRHFHVRIPHPGTGAMQAMRYATHIAAASLAAGLTAAAATSDAQTVGARRFDPTTNTYFVTIKSAAGFREMEVVPANRVRADVRASVRVSAGAWEYEYEVTVTPQSTQLLSDIEVPCAAGATPRDFAGTTVTRIRGTRSLIAEFATFPDRTVCLGVPDLAAGDRLTMRFTASFAPGFAPMHLIGNAPAVAWDPLESSYLENDHALAVMDSINGITGGWYEVTTVAPVRSPASIATPALAARALQDDLVAACEPLALIAPAGVCNSLRAKLDAVRQSIERGNANAAKGQVSALLLELDAQRGEHVREPAYIVLHTLAGLLQSQLAR